ncbi:Anaerobic ribonucleoside-triphosphate reductase activating protein, partial [Dysosmobacter welbionis]
PAEEGRDLALSGRDGGNPVLAAGPAVAVVYLHLVAALRRRDGGLHAGGARAHYHYLLGVLRRDCLVFRVALMTHQRIQLTGAGQAGVDVAHTAVEAAHALADILEASLPRLIRRLRVREGLPGKPDQVRLVGPQDALGNPGVVDAAHRNHRLAGDILHLLGVVRLIAVAVVHGGDHLVICGIHRDGDAEVVHAGLVQVGDDGFGVLNGETASHPLIGGEPVSQNKVWAAFLADILNDLQGKPHPVGQVAAVLVGALVGVHGHELRNHVAVGTVELNAVKSSFLGPQGGVAE